MKIRNRITVVFTSLTGTFLILVFMITYYLSDAYTDAEFFDRLEERANIVAQLNLEKDELSVRLYEDIRERHLQKLPNEKGAIFKVGPGMSGGPKDIVHDVLPPQFFMDVLEKGKAHTEIGGTYHVGILYLDNEGDFVVITSADNVYGKGKMENLRNILLMLFLTGMIMLSLLGRYYAGKVLYPIIRITDKVNEINAKNLHIRLETRENKDELARLSQTFNDMLDRLETTFELQSNFINNASHELRNPLAAILGETELALNRERHVSEYVTALLAIEKEAQRLDILVSALLELAGAGNDRKGLYIEPIRVDEMVVKAKHSFDMIRPDNNVRLNFDDLPDSPEPLSIHGNLSLLVVALINVMDNAYKFSDNGPTKVTIDISDRYVSILIRDHGIGIPKGELVAVTEPFFRAMNARSLKGFGVGLTLAHKIVKIHSGRLTIDSGLGEGTAVRFSFERTDL